jgi:hypothetical protein
LILAIAAKVASKSPTEMPAPGAGVAAVDAVGAGVATGVGVGAAVGVAVGDGDAAFDEHPATMAATATIEIASFLVFKSHLLNLPGQPLPEADPAALEPSQGNRVGRHE